ncbi:MAG TPA: M48 family peptidase [Thermosulfidibacter takaii]|uniref:M48 family peptidase n=1 Tax=Thermosulfidibacter takaii TaxID=412593 RepID=A0A7C0YDV2_9BACT|nr:M48 family peptidase [Thermosulfidibacter takaii]
MVSDLSVESPKVLVRKVKYPRIEFRTGRLTLILPPGTDPKEILEKHKGWISRKAKFIERHLEAARGLTLEERSEGEFKELVHSYVERGSRFLGVEVNKVLFRRMSTKWASCSSKGNITVNSLARFLPGRLIEYLVFHELAHLLERKHNDRFWRIVASRFPDHPELESRLFSYWFLVCERV